MCILASIIFTILFLTYKTSLKADKEDWGVIFVGIPSRRPLAPGGQRGETPNDTHYKTRSLKEMRLSCGLRMLLKLHATPMLSFSSELKNNEKQKLAFGGVGPAGLGWPGTPQNFIFSA